MRYLITGGLGVVGSEIARIVLANGHGVRIIDSCLEPRNVWLRPQLEQLGAEVIVRRLETIAEPQYFNDCDAIVHAAAHTGIPESGSVPIEDWTSNVDATLAMLEVMRVHALRIPTVVMSSVKPYAISDIPTKLVGKRFTWFDANRIGIDERCPLIPDEPYAASKMAQSAAAIAYARSYDLPITVLRFSNLYGPGPCKGVRHGWLTWFCIAKALGRRVTVQGLGHQARDMLYTTDIASAIFSALHAIEMTKGDIYNVGGGPENVVSVIEAVELLGLNHDFGPARQHEDSLFVTDCTKFSKVTGWKSRVRVPDGVRMINDWAHHHASELARLYEPQ